MTSAGWNAGSQRRFAAVQFAEAIGDSDVVGLEKAWQQLEVRDAANLAMLLASRVANVAPKVQFWFLKKWLRSGDAIRSSVNCDLVLLRALRRLLPAYAGGDMVLYRGDSAFNRRRRTYGMSWSASELVADGFAQGIWRSCQGGSVVLRADVPAGAILCAPLLHEGDIYGSRNT